MRHGQPGQHSGKIFLGQTDIPLSDRGEEEAAAAGDKLIELGARPKRLYTSDLLRAKETAGIIAKRFDGLPVIPDILFREMTMGTWDGELVEDIKAKFPEEYAKRGDDLCNYRTPGGENFYDLRGRVTREFYRIFAEDFSGAGNKTESGADDDPGDLVIVAHQGVIISLFEELHLEKPGFGFGLDCPTGSVTVLETPEWLWSKPKS